MFILINCLPPRLHVVVRSRLVWESMMGEDAANLGYAYGGASDEAEAVLPLGPGALHHAGLLHAALLWIVGE